MNIHSTNTTIVVAHSDNLMCYILYNVDSSASATVMIGESGNGNLYWQGHVEWYPEDYHNKQEEYKIATKALILVDNGIKHNKKIEFEYAVMVTLL